MPKAILVEPLRREEQGPFGDWLASLDRGLIYASVPFGQFLSMVTYAKIIHLVARRGDQIVGALPYAVSKAADGGCTINSLPWYGSHGGCWLGHNEDNDVRMALLHAYKNAIELLAPLFAVTILSPWEQCYARQYSAVLGQEIVDGRVGQISALPSESDDPEAALLATLKQKTRNLARKACRQGFEEVEGDCDESWQYLILTHRENMEAIGGKPKPRSHFAALRKCFTGDKQRLSVAYLDGIPVSALLLLKFGRTVEYFVPVVTKEFRSRQPLSFLIWRAMLASARQGYRYWNWGGTWPSQESLHHFKAGWGATDSPYSYLVSASAEGLSQFRRDPDNTMAAFPFFYLYPLKGLERSDPSQ